MITTSQLHQTNTDGYETEASTIGLRPGQWPLSLMVEGLGRFDRACMPRHEGGFALYRHPKTGAVLRVYND
jgi:hypothetical protein